MMYPASALSTRRLTRCAVLTALALALSVAEGLFPLTVLVPLPGLRLGLANLVTIYALCAMSGREALLILVARCLLGALVGGNLSALAFSLGGGLLAVYLSRTEAPSMGFIGLVLLVAAVILISPVAERRNLMGEQYWITNQRAILMTRDKTFFYMELSDIDDLQVVGGTTKGKSLVLGRCLFEEAKKLLRWRACHPKVDVQSHDETDRALGMIFYGVQGAEAAAELLRQGRDGEAA